jgi:hypothetical protein
MLRCVLLFCCVLLFSWRAAFLIAHLADLLSGHRRSRDSIATGNGLRNFNEKQMNASNVCEPRKIRQQAGSQAKRLKKAAP